MEHNTEQGGLNAVNKLLRQRCLDMNLNRTSSHVATRVLGNFFFNDKILAMVCDHQYSSSRGWAYAITNGWTLDPHRLKFGRLDADAKTIYKIKSEHMARRLKYFLTVLIARHPLERLVFLFEVHNFTRFIMNDDGYDYAEVFKSYVDVITRTCNTSGQFYLLSFRHFIQFVVNSPSHFYPWHTLYEACSPCSIRYDVLIRNEWPVNKKKLIIDKFNVTNEAIIKRVYTNTTVSNWLDYYRDIDVIEKRKLHEMYKYDFHLLGYKWPF